MRIYIIFYFIYFAVSCQFDKKPEQAIPIELTLSDISLDQETVIPANVQKLMKFYPDVLGFENNYLLFSDGSQLLYDDGKVKSFTEVLDSPDVEDMFKYEYKDWDSLKIPFQYDPGRIRNEEFFKKIYGNTKDAVKKNLVEITWCPKLVNQKVLVTTKNNIHLKIDSLSAELDDHPEFKQYIQNIGGTFNWRKISGTERLSMHSFGMTIDINVSYSDYWQWSCACKSEDVQLKKYRNRIPLELVNIFKKYGFIWGGNWYHFDTMHFEYRPELI
jgi:hypothetical protein